MIKFFWNYWEMGKAIIKLGSIEIEKQNFYQHKGTISIKNIDSNKIVVSNKVSFVKKGVKYFVGYKNTKKIRPLYIYLSQIWVHVKDTLMKVNICLFYKKWWVIRKI